MKKYRTDYLFDDNSFIMGVASAFNLMGTFFDYNYCQTDQEADAKALENDWGVIGQGLLKVVSG
ncbi:MAG: hypothetical protein LE178_04665 [Endomicrobium sp.]|nr:hypothetical protein [Endomicrobium sp.]